MSQILIQDVRLIDPINRVDRESCDVLLRDGVLAELGSGLEASPETVAVRRPGSVVSPAFLDLHCHLRDPGQPWKERVGRATAAAAAGGFGAVCAMANLVPPVDTVERFRAAQREAKAFARVTVLQLGACTEGLEGASPAPLEELARAGAVAFSDDGRNGIGLEVLVRVLRRAADLGRTVAVHPEDEQLLARVNPEGEDPGRWHLRPPDAELSAIERALQALRIVPQARLHLQHISTARGAELVRQAKAEGLPVTAEVTPHHLMLSGAELEAKGRPVSRCNPPLRTEADRTALWEALLDGTIDALASDHAPHELAPAEERAPGFSGVQLVLSAVLGQGGAGAHLPRLVEALSAGPRRVLGEPGRETGGEGLRTGEPASLTWFDPACHWTPDASNWLSLSTNTPFWGETLRGCVLSTFSRGRMVHLNPELVPELARA